VLTIQSGINKLRYARYRHQAAKNKPMRKVPHGGSAIGGGRESAKIERLYVRKKTKKTEHIEGAPGEFAKEAGR